METQLINNLLVFVWWADKKIHFWDVENGKLLQTLDTPSNYVKAVRVLGDGSKVFCLGGTIQAMSISTGKVVGEVESLDPFWATTLTVDDSRIWAQSKSSTRDGTLGFQAHPLFHCPTFPCTDPICTPSII